MFDRKFIIITAYLQILIIVSISGCNESNCGSVVTKCLLTNACSCDFKNCSCCKECFNCLGYLFTECCSCFSMCPQAIEQNLDLNQTSLVEEFQETVPGLFDILTEYPDDLDRWKSEVFPVDVPILSKNLKKNVKLETTNSIQEQDVFPTKKDAVTLNCTVAFWAQCMTSAKCKNSCLSMGAASYRWFHDGCCECVGLTCLNYGINVNKCSLCPNDETIPLATLEDDEDLFDENADYGEDDEFEDY